MTETLCPMCADLRFKLKVEERASETMQRMVEGLQADLTDAQRTIEHLRCDAQGLHDIAIQPRKETTDV